MIDEIKDAGRKNLFQFETLKWKEMRMAQKPALSFLLQIN